MPVCVCVCVSTFHLFLSRGHGQVSFISDFGYLNLITLWRRFCTCRLRHSHGRNFGPIFFKFGHDAALDHPVFAIESQQKSVSNFRFYEEPRIGLRMFLAKNSRQNQNFPTLNEVLLSINSDLLNTNLIIIWGLY